MTAQIPLPSPLTEAAVVRELIKYLKSGAAEKSTSEDGGCLYRSPSGNRCFVGLFLADEDLPGGLTGTFSTIRRLMDNSASLKNKLRIEGDDDFSQTFTFWTRVQRCHDSTRGFTEPSGEVVDWATAALEELGAVSRYFGLDIPDSEFVMG